MEKLVKYYLFKLHCFISATIPNVRTAVRGVSVDTNDTERDILRIFLYATLELYERYSTSAVSIVPEIYDCQNGAETKKAFAISPCIVLFSCCHFHITKLIPLECMALTT